MAALKALPRADVDAFLAEFDIKRVKDLPASRVAAALAHVERLTTGDDIDPFAD